MVEIAIAVATASQAVATIKKAISLGKDVSDLGAPFAAFFDSKDKVKEAKVAAENTPIGSKVFAKKSVEAFAIEVALAEHKTKQMEKALREMFVYSGNADVYSSMMRIRSQERLRRNIEAKRILEQKKFVADASLVFKMEYQLVFNVFIAVIGFIGGWMVNRVFVMLDRIDLDMKGIAVQYVAKDDYREDIREIKEMLGAIFKRLENKADK